MVSSILVAVVVVVGIAVIVGATQRDYIQSLVEADTQKTPEQQQTAVEDPSAKYYDEPRPVSYGCELTSSLNLRCLYEDGSSTVTVVGSSDAERIQSRLPYCNEIMEHRSVSLDRDPMMRCLYDVQG